MDDLLQKILDRQDSILEHIQAIETDLAVHIKRTDLLESHLKIVRDEVSPLKEDLLVRRTTESVRKELAESRKSTASTVLKIITAIVAIATAIVQIKRFL